MFEKREALKELFEHINNHHDEYDDDSVRKADGYISKLDNFEFCFLLSTFHNILDHSDVLFGVLQNKALDVNFCLRRVDEFCDTIERERGRFDLIYDSTVSLTGVPSARRGAQGDARQTYQKLHRDILDNILGQLRERFQDHGKIKFLSLVDATQFTTFKESFPDEAFKCLTESHAALFDLTRLKTELNVMYALLTSSFSCKRKISAKVFISCTK